MTPFYSLIKVLPNLMSGDSVTIGMILSSPKKVYLMISNDRKKIVKNLLSSDDLIIDLMIKELQHKVRTVNKSILNEEIDIILDHPIFNDSYLSHLSNSCNGVVTYSKPQYIHADIDDEKVKQLFHKITNQIEHKADNQAILQNHAIFKDRINHHLKSKLENIIHIDHQLNSNNIPTLYNPYIIDCIGKNGVLVGAKSLFFDTGLPTLEKNVNTFVSVITQLKSMHSQPGAKDKFYLIADEPLENEEAYNYWKNLKAKSTIFQVESSESDIISQEVISSGASTFLVE